ncbi:MAG: sensor histidine kinase [Candidatus Kariarchaeaceae archaeon]
MIDKNIREKKIHRILKLGNIGFFILNLEHLEIITANKYFLSISGYSTDDMPIPFALIIKNHNSRDNFLGQLSKNGQISNYELIIHSKNNSKTHVYCSGEYDAHANHFFGLLQSRREESSWQLAYEKISEDFSKETDDELVEINERLQNEIIERRQIEAQREKLLEELERSNQELKDFAYIVSHDLKAPLRGISSLATWISEDYKDILDEEGKENLELLVGRVKRMNSLIDGILRHSRVGRVKIFLEELNSLNIVRDVVSVLDIPEDMTLIIDPLPKIIFDETHLIQIFGNLVGNTLVHSDKKELRIHIGCETSENYWTYFVKDNGVGIDKDHFDKIFQIFQTLKPRDDKETTGIGLSLVKKIVELHGGRVWVESSLGEGSTFYFTVSRKLRPQIPI